MFSLSRVAGGRDGPEFTPVNTLLCDVQNRKLDRLHAVFKGLSSQILHALAEYLVSVSTNKNSPNFHFLF